MHKPTHSHFFYIRLKKELNYLPKQSKNFQQFSNKSTFYEYYISKTAVAKNLKQKLKITQFYTPV